MYFYFRNYYNLIAVAAITIILISACDNKEKPTVNLIPKPALMEVHQGYLKVDSLQLFGEHSHGLIDYRLDTSFQSGNKEAYKLEVDKNGIKIVAAAEPGLFYATQTLRQLWSNNGIPYIKIEDAPRFSYRGYHLDVSRHFFPKEFVMKLIDVMSFYKLNTFHWHLTDGAGWRIQIDKYPRLTSEASYRPQPNYMDWWEGGRKYVPEGTPNAYGGYFTKEDIREVVAYAASRHITVIPEIEMPGHSEEVFIAYPQLSCAGVPYKNDDFCIGNEETFEFIEGVLTEVMELFPSEYIHIGGDEASKRGWKTCPKCQARMKKEGLKDVDELQSYMIHRVEKFLNGHGRQIIGWDEILEGGLAPRATVMSWRGENGGIQSARMGHDVIMTPGSNLYFDFYQADPKTQPLAIGGYTPIKRVYGYDPVPADSLSVSERKHIIGVQANTWAEYIPTEKHMEYMMFPRMLALAEIAWTPQEIRNWEDFKPRVNAHIPVLQQMGINTFTLSDEIETTMLVDTIKQEIKLFLDAEKYPAEIRYVTDGSLPDKNSQIYDSPVIVKDSATLKAAIFKNGVLQGTPTEKKVDYHKAINKPVHYNSRLYKGYMAGGMNALVDGYRGGMTYLDGRWQGYLNDLDCVIDMGEITELHNVSARFMQITGPGVYQPGQVELLISEDGENYTSQGVIKTSVSPDIKELTFETYRFEGNWKARFVRLKATEANGKQFIFTDEIVVW